MPEPTEPRPAIDFSVAGVPLAEWLGQVPREEVIAAAEHALKMTDEPILVCFVTDDAKVNTKHWAGIERRALKRWFVKEHPDTTGRLRLSQRTVIEPGTHQDVIVVFVEYEPGWKPKSRTG